MIKAMFDYHLKLHHTQTNDLKNNNKKGFDYHLKLHHTQTKVMMTAIARSLTTI